MNFKLLINILYFSSRVMLWNFVFYCDAKETITADRRLGQQIFWNPAEEWNIENAYVTMSFHRSKMNEYLCRNYIALEILHDLEKLKSHHSESTNSTKSGRFSNTNVTSQNMDTFLMLDEGSYKYRTWLSRFVRSTIADNTSSKENNTRLPPTTPPLPPNGYPGYPWQAYTTPVTFTYPPPYKYPNEDLLPFGMGYFRPYGMPMYSLPSYYGIHGSMWNTNSNNMMSSNSNSNTTQNNVNCENEEDESDNDDDDNNDDDDDDDTNGDTNSDDENDASQSDFSVIPGTKYEMLLTLIAFFSFGAFMMELTSKTMKLMDENASMVVTMAENGTNIEMKNRKKRKIGVKNIGKLTTPSLSRISKHELNELTRKVMYSINRRVQVEDLV